MSAKARVTLGKRAIWSSLAPCVVDQEVDAAGVAVRAGRQRAGALALAVPGDEHAEVDRLRQLPDGSIASSVDICRPSVRCRSSVSLAAAGSVRMRARRGSYQGRGRRRAGGVQPGPAGGLAFAAAGRAGSRGLARRSAMRALGDLVAAGGADGCRCRARARGRVRGAAARARAQRGLVPGDGGDARRRRVPGGEPRLSVDRGDDRGAARLRRPPRSRSAARTGSTSSPTRWAGCWRGSGWR